MLSQSLEMTKSFTLQEGNTRKLVANQENTYKVGKGCCEKSKKLKKYVFVHEMEVSIKMCRKCSKSWTF
jgi:hypothetical protein